MLSSLTRPPSYRRATYLPSGHVVFHWMDGQAENVIIVPQVQPLGVLLPVVHNSNCSNVIDHLSSLSVEQIVSTVVAPVAEAQGMHSS